MSGHCRTQESQIIEDRRPIYHLEVAFAKWDRADSGDKGQPNREDQPYATNGRETVVLFYTGLLI
jgi:hypothetical protein